MKIFEHRWLALFDGPYTRPRLTTESVGAEMWLDGFMVDSRMWQQPLLPFIQT